ncbi:hypothetical protein Rhopal_004839-T1 [Rhodotorula paludigena]|uniref:GATA-type domain-containing protein n=1 Tax=Rhodotorula paludigena TaxID=86838 RepID=A0AAV5GGV0_9BASI|nr:hypothetical protein Rhopal_004839-T1 [Rhodotorula paludigena]
MQHSPAPGRRRSTEHGVHHHQPPQQHDSPPALSGLPTGTIDGGRRPKTPPDCCAVCGVTETPEWRKGPAGNRSLCNGCGLVGAKRAKEREHVGVPPPTSFEEIERELEGIGIERFKPSSGRYNLPRGTQQRIRDTQARTRAPSSAASSSKTGRPRSRSTKGEKDAAGALVGLRRASVSAGTSSQYASAMAPRSPPSSTRGRRSGSLVGEAGPSRPHYKLPALPPSSAYLSPPGGLGPSSTFSFGHLPTPSSSTSGPSARPPSPLRAASPVLAMPSPIRISPLTSARPATPLSSSTSRTFGAPRAPSPSPSMRPMSALAASTNRMSIAHLTSPTLRAPTPPRFEVQREAPAVSLATPTSALRRRSSSIAGVPCPRPPTATAMAQDKPPMVKRPTA